MKKKNFILAVLLSLGLSTVWAEDNSSNSNVRYVKTPRFARPLVEKWISEYAKVEPGIQFEIAKGGVKDVNLSVTFEQRDDAANASQSTIYFGEFAVLPITARNSEAEKILAGKRLNAKKLKQLYFLDDEFEEDVKKNKQFEQLTIYSGSNATSVAGSFAHSLGQENENFRGKRISGDDQFLNTAIQKDPLGVTFNALSNIFDLQSRQLKSDVSIIGIDVKKNLEQAFSNEASIDDLINILENDKVQGVAVEKVGLNYNGLDDEVARFLQWVLENGTQYNHQFGILNLDRKLAETERHKLETALTAQK